ncbi:MAG: hypothetical protein IKE85_08775 [Mogibacterium sp.]|nr:hypothetical protein [Mogibacterium sp.]
MRFKERCFALLLSLVMVLTFMPALAFADEPDVQLLPGTIWMDCEYVQNPDFEGSEEAIPVRVVSSNPAVIEASIDEEATSIWDVELEPKSVGTSTITVYYSLNGVESSTSALYTVKPFPAFADSITVDGDPVDFEVSHNYCHYYNYTRTQTVFRYDVANGWRIESAYFNLDGDDAYSGDKYIMGEALSALERGEELEVNFPESCTDLRIFVYFYNTDNAEVMHSIQLHRETEYDPDVPVEDPDIVTRFHAESDGSTRTIVGDDMSGDVNFPENGDNFDVNGVTYTYDSSAGCFRNGSTEVLWDMYYTGGDYDEATGMFSNYFVVEYSTDDVVLGYSKIYIEYINEITDLQFIPNGKTELSAADIQTEDGLDIGKRGVYRFFIPGDKIILTNLYNEESTTYEFTYDEAASNEDSIIFNCDVYGQAPVYSSCDDPKVGNNAVEINMLGGSTSTNITIVGDHEHTYVSVEGTDASCTEDGMMAHYKCPECGKLFVLENGSYVEKTAADLEIKATGHKWGSATYEWAEDNKSVQASHQCSVCNEVETEDGTVTAKETTAPSCEVKGETTYTATFTKAGFETQTKAVQDIEALGHEEGEGEITKRATKTEEGVMTYKCKECKQVLRTEVIAALGEDYTPVNQAAEDAVNAIDEASTDADAAAQAQTAADQAVEAAEAALQTAEASGDTAAVNAAKQAVVDAKATKAKAYATGARVAANKAKAAASAKQSAAAAQASTGTDAALAAAADAINEATNAQKAANEAVAAAEQALIAANATNDPIAIEAAGQALSSARTASTAAGNAVVQARTTFAIAESAKRAAMSQAAAAAAQPAEIQDLPNVKISKPKAAKKAVTVKWKKVSKKNQKKIGGIEIQVATDSAFANIVKSTTAGKKKTSKKIKGLTSKQTYWVRIRAYKDGPDGRHVSAWKSKKFKAK